MAVLTFIFLICSLRTNLVFVAIFFSLWFCFMLLTAAFWTLAKDFTGNAKLAQKLTVVCALSFSLCMKTMKLTCSQAGGACGFVTCMAGWYILLAVLLAIVDFPIQIPVGDLSTVIKGKSEKERQA